MRVLPFLGLLSAALAMPFDLEEIRVRDASQYSDDVARNMFFPLAMGNYKSDPQPCVTSGIQGKVKRFISVACDVDKKDTCAGYTAWSDSKKAVVLAFRGTDGDSQLILEILESIDKMIPMPGGGGVAHYFYTAFTSIWNGGMKDDFLSLRQQYPDYEIWITGHSLGGAIAAIAADYVTVTYNLDVNKIKMITYGEPRTGNATYANAHDARFPYSFRVVHNHDIVPQIPLQDMGYRHHSVEVWYPNDMGPGQTYKICTAQEDKSCQDGVVSLSTDDHGDYFKIPNGWEEAGCPKLS